MPTISRGPWAKKDFLPAGKPVSSHLVMFKWWVSPNLAPGFKSTVYWMWKQCKQISLFSVMLGSFTIYVFSVQSQGWIQLLHGQAIVWLAAKPHWSVLALPAACVFLSFRKIEIFKYLLGFCFVNRKWWSSLFQVFNGISSACEFTFP